MYVLVEILGLMRRLTNKLNHVLGMQYERLKPYIILYYVILLKLQMLIIDFSADIQHSDTVQLLISDTDIT